MSTSRAWARRALFSLACLSTAVNGAAQSTNLTQWPVLSDGLESVVEWDHYSIMVNGKRVFLFGGEFHPWRLPAPEMWEDVLQKMKAGGLNSMSFYSHWGFHAPNPETVDFETGAHNLTRLYELAAEIGIFVTARPGPYINAETNAGGFPLWVTTGAYGSLRNNDSRYTAAWTPYQDHFAQLSEPFQVTKDGTLLLYQIENEYGDQWENIAKKTPNPEAIDYMQLLEANARSNKIDVALTHNNPNLNTDSWSKDFDTVNAGGDVDIYGVDSYPACWSCVSADCGASAPPLYTVVDYYDNLQSIAPRQPSYMPEFQGGAYNPWYGPATGCLENTNQDFANIYYRHNIAEKVSAMSLYMIYGGTNWGWLAAPFVPTSYDYAAPISEDRSIGAKYYETKNLALFTRVAEDLRKVDRIGNSTSYSTNPAVFTTELKNPDTAARFYVTIHTTTTSPVNEPFQLKVNTSVGAYTIPQHATLALNGYQSKIIVTDFHFADETLIYSTAEVLSYAIFDGKPTLALWVPTGESGEFYLKGAKHGSVESCNGCSDIGFYPDKHGLVVTFGQQRGLSTLIIDDGVRVLLMDRSAAYYFFVPGLNNDPLVPVDQTAFVQGPYLVRSAKTKDHTIVVTGDSNQTSTIEVFTSKLINSISWNGKSLKTTKTSYGSLKASLAAPVAFTPPQLGNWKVKDSLPERFLNYSDSGAAWVTANHTTTPSTFKTATLPYLYVDEYGFHTGNHLWRGHFNGTATGAYLELQGGTAFGWSAFLNGDFVGSFLGNTSTSTGALTLSFDNATVNKVGPNVLLVLQDNSGHDETSQAINVRGILNATLLGGSTFSEWKVAGTAGGSSGTSLDPLRTIYNEGGLTGERLGWHLPGFDDSTWESGSLSKGFSGAGVKFYRTTVPLCIPDGHDVSLSFNFTTTGVSDYRALLYVNGYQYARWYPYLSEISNFPVPPGILNYNGENVIVVALWAQTEQGASVNLHMQTEYITESSLNVKFDGEYLRPGWTASRLAYA